MIRKIDWRLTAVNDKALDVLNQYDISVNRVVRGRGGMVLSTGKGCRLFLSCDKPERFYERENAVTQAMISYGFANVDSYVKNLDGKIITEDKDGRRYIVKNWFEARECDIKDIQDILRAVRALAHVHITMDKISRDGGVWLSTVQRDSLFEIYDRHTRELKKVCNYLKNKKNRQEFEQMAYQYANAFYDEAKSAMQMLRSGKFDDRLKRARDNHEMIHGSFNYHNIMYGTGEAYITNFDKCRNECQIWDLYQFMRKILEKYNWDEKMCYRIVNEYDKEKSVSDEEFDLLMVLLSYPEKFWKIINQYFNSNKSWIPDKNVEKLKKVIEQNRRKAELIDKMCSM